MWWGVRLRLEHLALRTLSTSAEPISRDGTVGGCWGIAFRWWRVGVDAPDAFDPKEENITFRYFFMDLIYMNF